MENKALAQFLQEVETVRNRYQRELEGSVSANETLQHVLVVNPKKN